MGKLYRCTPNTVCLLITSGRRPFLSKYKTGNRRTTFSAERRVCFARCYQMQQNTFSLLPPASSVGRGATSRAQLRVKLCFSPRHPGHHHRAVSYCGLRNSISAQELLIAFFLFFFSLPLSLCMSFPRTNISQSTTMFESAAIKMQQKIPTLGPELRRELT